MKKERPKKEHINQFGGKRRVHISIDEANEESGNWSRFLENIPETDNRRLNDRQEEIVDLLKEGMAQLTEIQRRVILIMSEEGLTERDAAKVLNMSASTLHTHVVRARKKLLEYVKQNGEIGLISRDQLETGDVDDEADNEASNSDSADQDNRP